MQLMPGAADCFVIVHHFDGSRILVTVQTYQNPGSTLALIDVRGWKPALEGDMHLWSLVPTSFVGYLNDAATGAAGYYLVRIEEGRAEVSRLDWFTGAIYDLDYQSIVGVADVPGSDQLVFGIQRSSELVLCAGDGRTAVKNVRLTGHVGNPVPRFRTKRAELVVTDYDVLVCVDAVRWEVTRDHDGGAGTGKRHFIGDPWWPETEDRVAVARPAASDVQLLDMDTFALLQTFAMGRQPLDAAVLPDGTAIARDWKSGDLLTGA